MGNREAVLNVGEEVDAAIGLIREEHTGASPKEAIGFLLESAKALKNNDFDGAVQFAKRAQIKARPDTEYLLSRAKELVIAAEKSYGTEKFEEAFELWNQAIEEYRKAGKVAEQRGEQEIVESISVVEQKINENIEKAETAKDNREMLRLVREGDNSVGEANRLFEAYKFDEAKKAYEKSKSEFKEALVLAERRDFETDRKEIIETLRSVDTSIETVLLSEGDFMLAAAEDVFNAGNLEKAEKTFSEALRILDGLGIKEKELEEMRQRGREKLVNSKLEQGRKKMGEADLLVESAKYYEAKETYKKARSRLEATSEEAKKYGFKELAGEMNGLAEVCSRNISEATGALMDISGVKPAITQVGSIKRGNATIKKTAGNSTGKDREPTKEEKEVGEVEEVDSEVENEIDVEVKTEVNEEVMKNHTAADKLQALYDIFEMVGEGGFAKVFRAKKKGSGKTVALKVPRLDEKNSSGFIKEVATWLNLNHPNIVKLQRADYQPLPYIEVEYVEGVPDGGKVVKELEYYTKPVPEVLAVQIIHDTAKGLQHAHEKGIYHHDIKPLNILLQPGEGNSSNEAKIVPKITDFGLAKISARSSHTSTKGYSLLYAAPEQMDPETYGKPDQRTDIYQLGMTFFEILSGASPYNVCTPAAVFGQICSPDIKAQPISKHKPEFAPYDGVFEKLLAKRKEDRYQTVKEFLEALEALNRIKQEKTELKLTLEETRKTLKVTTGHEQIYKLKNALVETSTRLIILYARSNDKAELANSLNDLSSFTGEHKKEIQASLSQIELMLREGISIGDDFIGGLKILMHKIEKEVKEH